MDISTLIEAILGTGIVSTYATYLVTRKKYLQSVKTDELENLRRTLNLYIDIVEDNKKRLDDYQERLAKTDSRVAMLTDENIALRKEVKELRLENDDLRLKLTTINTKNHEF